MLRLKWLLLSAVALCSPALAASDPAYGPLPEWATTQPLIVKPRTGEAASIDLLLWDTQIRLGANGIETVVHYAVRLNDAQALASGNLAVMWDPAFDSATINSVKIIRGNEVIDPLAKGQKFTVLRREQGLEQQTLDGRLTASLQAEGLQVGDVIELTQTVVHRDPTLKGHVEAALVAAYPSRFERARMRVVLPGSVAVRQRTFGGLPASTVQKSGRDLIYQWDLSPLQPDKPAEFAPARFLVGAGFEMTDYQSWSDLSATFLPLFEKAATIPSASPLQAEIQRIKAVSSDPKVRAADALALVENKVRYVNIALGVGGLVPVDADVTWQRRFGDCKAKTALLTAILRAVDIDATPVLVSTQLGDGLDQRLPKIAEFNHAIVRAKIGGRDYWLDGTRIGDVSLDTLEAPNYRWALPIAVKAMLVPIVQTPLTQPHREKIIVTDATNGVTGPVPTTLDIVLRGDSATLQNLYLNSVDPSRRDEVLKQQMEHQLDRFVISKISSNYDATTHTSRVHAEGLQTLNISNGTYWSETPSPGFKADFRRTSPRDLDAPVAIDFPTYQRSVQTLILPKTLAINYPLRPADVSATVAGVEYERTVTRKGAAVTIDTSSRSLVSEIGIAEARAAESQLRKLDDDNYRFAFVVAVEPTADELSQLLGSAPKTSDDYTRGARKYLNSGKSGEAMAMLDKALALSPNAMDARSMRASLHVALGEDQPALTDADAVLKIKPTHVQARAIHAAIMIHQQNKMAALADAQALASADNAEAQLTRARIYAGADQIPQAMAALDLALSYDPDPLTYVYRARLMPLTDQDGRRRQLDTALKLNPRDPLALASLAALARELGDFPKQLALLDQAFLLAPDNLAVRGQRAVALAQAGRTDDATREFDAVASKDLSVNDLNNQCWYKAMANVELTRALGECDKSLALQDRATTHDSKALVLYRLKRFEDAVKEYSLALASGDSATALYGRSLAYNRIGMAPQAAADAAKALKLDPGVARQFASYGVNP